MSEETRRRFPKEFKREAVQLAFHGGRRLSEVSKELDVRPDTLRRWKEQLEGEPVAAAESVELRKLRRELARAREERDILKKALSIFSERQP